MREYLREHSVEFDDRNIRYSAEAKEELLSLTGELVVPLLAFGDQRIAGFDPEALDQFVTAYRDSV